MLTREFLEWTCIYFPVHFHMSVSISCPDIQTIASWTESYMQSTFTLKPHWIRDNFSQWCSQQRFPLHGYCIMQSRRYPLHPPRFILTWLSPSAIVYPWPNKEIMKGFPAFQGTLELISVKWRCLISKIKEIPRTLFILFRRVKHWSRSHCVYPNDLVSIIIFYFVSDLCFPIVPASSGR